MASLPTGGGSANPSGRATNPAKDDARRSRAIADGWLRRLERYLVPVLRRRAWKRVADEIATYRRGIKAGNGLKNPDETRAPILGALEAAENAVGAGDIDGAWQYLQVARRMELLALKRVELKVAAAVIRAEANKLKEWRKAAVQDLLTVPDGQNLDAAHVCGAALLRDEHYNNDAYKDGLRRATALWLAVALLFGLVMLLYIACNGVLKQIVAIQAGTPPPEDALFRVLLGLALVGFVGAAASAITTAQRPDKPSRIPEMISTVRVTLLRLLMGPLSAIVVYFAVWSEFYDALVKVKPDGYALLVLAFVAGFSERLVRRVVETVAGKQP